MWKLLEQLRARVPAWVLVVLLPLLAAVGVVVAVDDTDRDGRPDRITVTINQTSQAPPGAAQTITVPKAAVDEARERVEDGLRGERPEQAEQTTAGLRQLQSLDETIGAVRRQLDPLPTAGASAGVRGCVTRFVRNQSSRGGVRPIWQVLHYTVSPNRPGWDDVNAIVAYFNSSSSQASSHFVIDREGHCAYIVPIEQKAWTQAAGNPLSISYEVINTGGERPFLATAGYRRLRSVMRQVSRRTGIPLTRGSVYPPRAGIVQHADGGVAWGGHHDIGPFSLAEVIEQVNRPGARVRRWCRRAHADIHQRRPGETRQAHRQHLRREAERDRLRRQRARERGFRCRQGQPVPLRA